MPSTSNTKVSVLAPTSGGRADSPCIDTERSSAANARSAPTVSVTRRSTAPWPPWRETTSSCNRRPSHRPACRYAPQPFDADALEYHFTTVAAKLAIAQELGLPLSKLSPDARAFIDHVLEDTRMRRLVLGRIRAYFRAKPSGADHAG